MSVPVLALREVVIVDGPRLLFDAVDLALEPRARACLVGRNATGKSTLLRVLAGDVAPDSGRRTASAGLSIVLVAQEPVVEGASLGDYASCWGASRHAALESLTAFGLDPAAPATRLSGGEMRRAALAAALAADPDVLLLDEPTNHLDIPSIQLLEAQLAKSRAALLIVSHDRAFLARVTSSCFWLENRKVRRLDAGFARFASWSDKIAATEAEDTRRLDLAVRRDEHWLARGVTARRARNEGRMRRLLALRADKAQRLSLARGELRLTSARGAPSGRRVVEAVDVAKAFDGRVLLSAFSTRIMRGERVAIVGGNGSGKTTLVKIILGQIEPDSGSVRLGSSLQIGHVDQARAALNPGLTLLEILAPNGGDQLMTPAGPRHVSAYASDFLFRGEQLRQPVESLSGGERNRLLLARVLSQPSNLLVLDEPTNDLDMESLDVLEELLSDYQGTLILVSHDRDFIDRLATSTIGLNGRGGFVETPGGWSDFESQNPDFLDPPAARSLGTPVKVRRPRAVQSSVRLSFGELRRLDELEVAMPALAAQIAAAERRLADPELYLRDPQDYARQTALLERGRAALAAAEDQWLVLEERRQHLSSTTS